ncbi:MAG: hypothetical protein KKC68_04350 [Candidatus Thermoplasmatota archaeon]|nr:hypothetical protein [Candidatus Thermoplasmatota archaeon]MBU1940982.1 hypothetical protein [Candidatus Thermoplasmatota archaeon]
MTEQYTCWRCGTPQTIVDILKLPLENKHPICPQCERPTVFLHGNNSIPPGYKKLEAD